MKMEKPKKLQTVKKYLEVLSAKIENIEAQIKQRCMNISKT